MTRGGRRYPLVIYREVIDRWWPVTLLMALGLAALAWPVKNANLLEPWRWHGLLGLSGMSVAGSILLLYMRNKAYVQAFTGYLKLRTPLLRLNISYKRIRRYTTAEFRTIFPPNKLRGWKRDLIAPLSAKSALVLELSGWPAPPRFIRIFFSQFFFRPGDKTAHFVILVDNWMALSTEIDSKRNAPKDEGDSQPRAKERSILGKLPRRD